MGIVLVLIGIPTLLTILGIVLLKKDQKTAKTLLIIALVYVLIGLGSCGYILYTLSKHY